MLDDAELLRRFADEGSTAAFDALARRHLDLVYSAALRQTGGHVDSAKDVTQMVLIDLARKAGMLKKRRSIVGWLHTATRYAAATVARTERNRKAREAAAVALNPPSPDERSDANWELLQPVLDDALGELKETEREAVLLRYFKDRSYAAIARELSLTETAARSRVDRALERLRRALSRRGIESTATALAISMVRGATTPIPLPIGFATRAIGAAVAAGAGGATASAGVAVFAGFNFGKLAALAANALVMKASTAVLVASLAANAALGSLYCVRRTPAADYERLAGISIAPVTRAPQTPVPAETAGSAPALISQPKLDLADQATLIRKMEEDGFDRAAIARGITGLHVHWSRPWMREEQEQRWARNRRWNLNPQFAEPWWNEREQKYQQRNAQAEAAVAAAGYDSGPPDPQKDLPYLSKEKAAAVKRIEKDYAAISGSSNENFIRWEGPDRKNVSVLWPEFEKDIRAVLSPAEATQYLRANSPAAQQVQRVIKGPLEMDLEAETYGKIVDAVVAGTDLPTAFRHQLGDARFLTLIEQIDRRAASSDMFYRDAGLSTRLRADLFIQTVAMITELQNAPKAAQPELARQAYDALVRTAALRGTQLDAFNQTRLGRALLSTAASAGK